MQQMPVIHNSKPSYIRAGPISQAFYRAEREQPEPPALAATRDAAAAAQAAAAMGMGRYKL